MRAAAGKTLGPCLLQEEIGRGGSSIVFLAHHAPQNRPVAIKVIAGPFGSFSFRQEDSTFLARFQQEAQLVSRLSHPHILALLESGQTGPEDDLPDAAYLIGEYMSGGNLAGYLERHAETLRGDVRARCELAVAVAEQIGAALDHAHSHDVLHRDLKPSNILLAGPSPDARDASVSPSSPISTGRFVLSDFGLARLLQSGASLHLTATGLVAGTPAYMAPEQALGEPAEPATDLYGLAVVLYEIVVGRVPFDAETPLATMLAHVHQPPPAPRRLSPDVPRAVEVVLLHALAKARDERYGSGYELSRALRAAAIAAFGKHALHLPASTVESPLDLPSRRAQNGHSRKDRGRVAALAARRPHRSRLRGTARFLRYAALGSGATALIASIALGSAALVFGPGRFRVAGFAERFVSSTLGPSWTEAAPRDGARDEPLVTRVVVRFSHEMDQQSVQEAFSIEPAVPVRFEWNGRLLTVQPEVELDPLTPYVVAIDNTRALDLDGRPLSAPLRRRFTTSAGPDTAVQVAPAPAPAAPAVGLGNLPFSLFPPQPTAQPVATPIPTVRPPAPSATVRLEPILPAATYAPPTVQPQPPDTSIVAGLVVTAEQVDQELAADPVVTPVLPTPMPSTTPLSSQPGAQPTAPATPAAGGGLTVTPTSASQPQSTPTPSGGALPVATGTMSVFPTATPPRGAAPTATEPLYSGSTPVPGSGTPVATSTVGQRVPTTQPNRASAPTATVAPPTPASATPTLRAGTTPS